MNRLIHIIKTAFTFAIFVFIISGFFGSTAVPAVLAETEGGGGRIRFVPITVGDVMIAHTQEVSAGDCCNGPVFPAGQQLGGSVTFPMPEDYIPGTSLTLDLFLNPIDAVAGNVDFYVRWVDLSAGGSSSTGSSVLSTPVAVAGANNLIRQSFTLSGQTAPMPQIMELTIRRNGWNAARDTYTGRVSLVALRLMYQSSWSTSYLPSIQN